MNKKKIVVEVGTDEDLKGEKVLVISFNPPNYEGEEIWISIHQEQKVRSPLRVSFKKHEEDLLESLKEIKLQYTFGLMTVASRASGDYGIRDVQDMLEDQESGRILKRSCSTAFADGRHRHSCIVKLTESGEPSTEKASQPVGNTLIKAPGSQVLTDHELRKLRRSANVVSALVLCGSSIMTIIKPLFQYSKIFYSSYNICFDETRINHIAKDLVSCGLVQGAVISGFRRYDRVTKLFRRFPDALRLVASMNEEPAEDESISGKEGLGITYLDNAEVSNLDEQEFLLSIDLFAANSKEWKQLLLLNAGAFYAFADALITDKKNVSRRAPAKTDWTF